MKASDILQACGLLVAAFVFWLLVPTLFRRNMHLHEVDGWGSRKAETPVVADYYSL